MACALAATLQPATRTVSFAGCHFDSQLVQAAGFFFGDFSRGDKLFETRTQAGQSPGAIRGRFSRSDRFPRLARLAGWRINVPGNLFRRTFVTVDQTVEMRRAAQDHGIASDRRRSDEAGIQFVPSKKWRHVRGRHEHIDRAGDRPEP